MDLDPVLTFASFAVGIVVGLTGMDGGAWMTPVLVLFFDGTVHLGLVKWLWMGDVVYG